MPSTAHIEQKEDIALLTIKEGAESVINGILTLVRTRNNAPMAAHLEDALSCLTQAKQTLTLKEQGGLEDCADAIFPTICWQAATPQVEVRQESGLTMSGRGELFLRNYKRQRLESELTPLAKSDPVLSSQTARSSNV